jgi:hypothetical protein
MTPERQRKYRTVETTIDKTGKRRTPAEEQRKESKGNHNTEGNISKEIQPKSGNGSGTRTKEIQGNTATEKKYLKVNHENQ